MRESSQFTADRTLASGAAGCCDFSVVSAGFADTIVTPDEQNMTAIAFRAARSVAAAIHRKCMTA
jgi:hypothetical protein